MAIKYEPEKIRLSPQDLVEVRQILKEHMYEYAVYAFGSRVRGTAKKYSDLDLAIITIEPISLSKMADLVDAFDESGLTFKVDVVDWATTSDTFRQIIDAEKVVLQTGEN